MIGGRLSLLVYPVFSSSLYHSPHLRSTYTGISGHKTSWSDNTLSHYYLLLSALLTMFLEASAPVSNRLFNGINVCFILHASERIQFLYSKETSHMQKYGKNHFLVPRRLQLLIYVKGAFKGTIQLHRENRPKTVPKSSRSMLTEFLGFSGSPKADPKASQSGSLLLRLANTFTRTSYKSIHYFPAFYR